MTLCIQLLVLTMATINTAPGAILKPTDGAHKGGNGGGQSPALVSGDKMYHSKATSRPWAHRDLFAQAEAKRRTDVARGVLRDKGY